MDEKGRGECETGSKTGSPGEDKAREIESSALPATCERYVAEERATNERRNTIETPWRDAARSNRPTRLMVS